MARVFIVEPPTVNVENAKKYGEIVILLKDAPKISALDTDNYAGKVIERLEECEYNPKEDFFCLAGSLSATSVAIAAMLTRYSTTIKCLMFNGGRSTYVLRTLGRWAYSEQRWESKKGS